MVFASDDDVRRVPATDVIDLMRRTLAEHHEGRIAAPPRLVAHLPTVDWEEVLFTVGANPTTLGFRVGGGAPYPRLEQFTAVFDRATGELLGLVRGMLLGARRTAALAAVATDHLARPDASTLGIIGAGRQAATHLWAVNAVRPLTEVKVFSRDPQRRAAFAHRMTEELGLPCLAVDGPRQAVEGSDLVTLVTTSTTPVIEADWVAPGAHVTTLGPTTVEQNEAPAELAARAGALVTDSLAQLGSYAAAPWVSLVGRFEDVRELGAVVVGEAAGRRSPEEITVFTSVGLAGTEVVLAAEVLRRMGHDGA